MKQVININFHGQVVPIEVSAFDLLKNYTDSLARFFANEEGKEEIINDIESRIAELFQERLKKGATCITDDDVNAIIKSMGRPEEFDGDEEKTASSLGAGEKISPPSSSTPNNTGNKRLYRDENNKVIGGVCSGLANYFGTDPIIIRIAFVLLAFAGAGLLAYFILWIAVPSTASQNIGSVRKKLFRDPDDKIIGGVCSGIGNYFGINPWIPRALFLIPFLSFVFHWSNWGFYDFPNFINFSFSPGAFFLYVIFWLVIPEASGTAEKLEMKGEKVDMNSIKNSVMEEMKGVQQRAEKFAKEATGVASGKSKVMGSEMKAVAKKGSRSLGDVIVFLLKIFAYCIIGLVVLSLVMALFGIAIFAIGIFPLKDFVLTEGWQNVYAWGTLIFFIAVPVVGIITWIIRRLAKVKSNSKILTVSFVSMWVLGWVSFMLLISSVVKDFKSVNTVNEQEVVLNNPAVNKLELTNSAGNVKNGYRYNIFRLEPFEGLDEDTAFVRNVEVVIKKAINDSFHVTMKKMANGRNKRYADTAANLINYKVEQQDSLLVFDKGVAINKHDKFRNQRVVVTVYVPVGKQIRVNRNVGWGNNVHIAGPWNDGDWYDEDEGLDWKDNTDYIMKADGLYTLDGRPANEDEDEREKVKVGKDGIEINDDGNQIKIDSDGIRIKEKGEGSYRYNSKDMQTIDSLQQKVDADKKRAADSLKKSIEESKKELEKLEAKKITAMVSEKGNTVIPSYQMPLMIQL